MLRIDLSRQAVKFLKRLPPKHGRQVATKIMELRDNPTPHDSIVMKGKASLYRRADVGEYRIVYRVVADTLSVIVVGNRNDSSIYRQIERKL
ncbi:MAG: type II toxin-antitoxin system RelE/ParE family toxin [Rhodospirillales bacterium]|nr:type II toxin-antitoxin system RelE/ParE family toxin [Rhodospirillales bacterium]